jgi:hypothetical protein
MKEKKNIKKEENIDINIVENHHVKLVKKVMKLVQNGENDVN